MMMVVRRLSDDKVTLEQRSPRKQGSVQSGCLGDRMDTWGGAYQA